MTYDRIPQGGAELRRESDVVCRDGQLLGPLAALVVDGGFAVTNVVLNRGRLWNHHEITVAVALVASFTSNRVQLSGTRADAVPAPVRHGRPYHGR